jgi:hypothetical protein
MTARTGRAHKTRGDEMKSKNNEGLTPDEVRAARITEGTEHRIEAEKHTLGQTDRLIEYLQVNREHIDGIAVVVLAKQGDALYDPEDHDASEGLSFLTGTGTSVRNNLCSAMEDLIDGSSKEDDDGGTELPEELASILNALKA